MSDTDQRRTTKRENEETSMQIEDVMRKVRALLARADETRNDNPHERETALRMANAMMDKYQIEATQLDADDMGERGKDGMETGTAVWRSLIIHAVSKLYGCYCYRQTGRGAKTYVIGRAHWRHVVLDMSAYLIESIDREAKNRGGCRAYLNSFRKGAAHALHTTVSEIQAARRRGETVQASVGTALVVVESYANELVHNKAWATAEGIRTRSGKSRSGSNRHGYSAGRAYGSSLSLNGQMGSGSRQRRIGS